MIDVEKIVDKLNEAGLLRANRIMGDYYSIFCPFHKDGQERKPSCGILMHEQYRNGQHYPAGFCHCFTCGYAKPIEDAVSDMLKAKNMTGLGLDWLKKYVPGFDIDNTDIEQLIPASTLQNLTNSYAMDYIAQLSNTQQQQFVSEEELASYRYTVPYMYERGLTDQLIEAFDIGFDPNHIPPGRKQPVPCITFPVRDKQGRTLFFVRRSVSGKYFNMPKDIQKPVYGIDMIPKGCTSIVICESCLNALTAIKYGKTAVALLGTGNPYQIQQLKELGIREFIIALDPDEAGRKGTARLKRELKKVALVWEYADIPEGKDLNDLTFEEFQNLTLV